jgi:hypothetical protein
MGDSTMTMTSARARVMDNIAVGVVLAIFLLAIYLSFGYGFRARLVPIVVASFGVIVLVAQLVLQNLKSGASLDINVLELISRGAAEEVEPVVGAPGAKARTPEDGGALGRKWVRELLGIALVLVFLGVFIVLGPLPAIFLFMAAYLATSRYAGVLRALAYAAATVLAIHIVFTVWLGVDLDIGLVKIIPPEWL